MNTKKHDFTDAKFGDKVVSKTFGKGVILQVCKLEEIMDVGFSKGFPYHVYTTKGKLYNGSNKIDLFYE